MSVSTVYAVYVTHRVEREARRLPSDIIRRINATFEQLAHNPRPHGVVKLTGQTGSYWRIRVGSYRILYQIDDQRRRIDVYRIKHRRDVYRS